MAYVLRGVGRWWECRVLEKPKYPLPAVYYLPFALNRPPIEQPPSYSTLYPQDAKDPGDSEESRGAKRRRSRRRGPPRSSSEESCAAEAGHVSRGYNMSSTLFSDDPPAYQAEDVDDYTYNLYAVQAVSAAIAVANLPGNPLCRYATWNHPVIGIADVIADYYATNGPPAKPSANDGPPAKPSANDGPPAKPSATDRPSAKPSAPAYQGPPSYAAAISQDYPKVPRASASPPARKAQRAKPKARKTPVMRPIFSGSTLARLFLEPVPEEDEEEDSN